MTRIFITGSSDGLGFLAGVELVEQGHTVVFHARTEAKAIALKTKVRSCEAIVVGDVSTIDGMSDVAAQVNRLGRFDAIIHNVAVGAYESRVLTCDGITQLFAVNVVAPYILTALIEQPKRLIYLSSDMHAGGNENLDDPQWQRRLWNSTQAYSDTKLYDLVLAMYVARRWPRVLVNALDPGWVPTRLGGVAAPGDLKDGAATQVWLAVSDEPSANVSGRYFYHQKPQQSKRAAARHEVQERLVAYLERLTQIRIPFGDGPL
jgi:NAD(P)-dependent dehydrogenase (short-subunit alcohol dehydrogenase family)